MFIQYPDI